MSLKFSLIGVIGGVLSASLVAALPSSVRSQADEVLLNGVQVQCDAFRKNSDGTWTQTRKTEATYGIASMLVNGTTFRRNEIFVFVVDLVALLELKCTPHPRKK
jgi:hypothetical protein